jgi:hypothetical protein
LRDGIVRLPSGRRFIGEKTGVAALYCTRAPLTACCQQRRADTRVASTPPRVQPRHRRGALHADDVLRRDAAAISCTKQQSFSPFLRDIALA